MQPVDSTLLVTELLQPKPGHIWRAPSPPPFEDQLALVSPNLVIWQRPPRGLCLFSCYCFLLTIIGSAISIILSVHLRQFGTMDWLNLCDNFVLKSNMMLLLLNCFSHVWLCATHRRQLTRLPRPWDSPGKNNGVGCHFLLQCMKVKSESEVAQSCPTLSNPMDCSTPGSSVHGIFQARVLEWGAIAFSENLI